jgi:hypothetical protein
VPAIFEVEGFGLVRKSSAFGVIEVKRSNYSGIENKIESFFEDVEARKIVADSAGPIRDYKRCPGIAVICVLESSPSARLQSLINEDKVVAIFEKQGETITARPKDVFVLVNFLHFITWRCRIHGTLPEYPQIQTGAIWPS